MTENKQNNYNDFIKNNKILKSNVNGLYRFLVLWIIKYQGSIHGYGIMKELDKFFQNLIEEGVLKKSNPSKIYPILKQMEEYELISGEEVIPDDKKVTFYKITDKGLYFIQYIFKKFMLHSENSQWKLIYEDMMEAED
ncbi:PadR family transcriptional regulator [Methanobrevibacter sp.]|uniref:PadR family transcriptional regulator n=1 Tax=Methanobrevibacter sp. TaxID=66852 RepID=UPI0025D38C31|nr:PadR family transcriptional regulator [Methanobrevibacter sp.]MBQ2666075.1 PadR family transcriptional regulator [Methanobrevibacter sp.]